MYKSSRWMTEGWKPGKKNVDCSKDNEPVKYGDDAVAKENSYSCFTNFYLIEQ